MTHFGLKQLQKWYTLKHLVTKKGDEGAGNSCNTNVDFSRPMTVDGIDQCRITFK